MNVMLQVIDGTKPAEFQLKLPAVLGRDSEADLKISDKRVSRKHCLLDLHDSELFVRDLGSANGTLVNGQPVDGDRPLSADDQLTVGRVTFRAQCKETGTLKAAAEPDVRAIVEPEDAVEDAFDEGDDAFEALDDGEALEDEALEIDEFFDDGEESASPDDGSLGEFLGQFQ